MDTVSGKMENNAYNRLLEYCRYMYEGEKERTKNLNDAVKVYLIFMSAITGIGVLKLITWDEMAVLLKQHNLTSVFVNYPIIGIVMFCVSFALFVISAIFTILVLKVWRFERLCDPERLVIKAITMNTELELLSTMIADFAIAANKNHIVNEKKAKLLSYGLWFLMCSLFLFSGSWLFIRLIPLI